MQHNKSINKIDVTDDKNLLNYAKVDVGFSAQKMLKELVCAMKVSDRQALEFRMECRSFLQDVVKKLFAKCPMNYPLVKNVTALDPRQMADTAKQNNNKSNMRCLLIKLIENVRFNVQDADDVVRQYSMFINTVATKRATKFAVFNPSTFRIDALLIVV